jgi:hypothetical protein
MWLSDRQKIGVALVAFGVFFMFLGSRTGEEPSILNW